MAKLRKLEGAVDQNSSAMKNVLRSPSPSINWSFATEGFGLPYGMGMVLYGPPKGGKSIIANTLIGQMHQDDLEAVAVVFNTELRGEFQQNSVSLQKWGIDSDRFITFDVNQPELIFDRIEKDIDALIQEGLKIKMVIIDSLSAIQGRCAMNADSVMTQQIGDQAATIKDGLARILPVIRKHKIAFICTTHVRAEMDMKEQMRGKTIKMQASWATKHVFEYFCYVEPNQSKTGKVSLAGEEFNDPSIVDFMNKEMKTGRKIRFKVEESSVGREGRVAEFTLDYNKGIINQYEEIFTLGLNYGVIEKPNNVTYKYGEYSYRGLVACLTAVRDNKQMQEEILEKVKKKDFDLINGVAPAPVAATPEKQAE
jgi:RecA/RadA recombinase